MEIKDRYKVWLRESGEEDWPSTLTAFEAGYKLTKNIFDSEIYDPDDNKPSEGVKVIGVVSDFVDPIFIGYCHEENRWFHWDNEEYFDADCYVQRWAYIPDLSNRKKQTEWISVDDRLPDEDGYYLVFRDNKMTSISSYATNYGFDSEPEFYSKEITHWQPLPEPPTE